MRKVIARRVFPRARHQIPQNHFGHIHQHQADQNFVGVKFVFKPSRDGRPKHAPCNTRQNHSHQNPAARFFVGQQCHTAGRHSANDKLPFSTNVPNIGAKTNSQAQGNDQQRRCLDHQFAQSIGRLQGLPKKHLQTTYRVFAKQHKQADTQSNRDEQGQQRRAIAPKFRGFRAPF